jgi:hypothetical protein
MFPVKRMGEYTLYTSRKLHLITSLLLTIFSLCFAMTIIRKSNTVVGKKFYKKRNKVSNFGITFEFIFGIVILYTLYFMSFVKTKHVKNVMMSLNRVDDLLKNMKQKFRYGRFVCYQLIIIFSGLMMVTLIASMQIQNIRIEKFPPLSLHMWILFIYPLVPLYDMNSQFGITAMLIYERFKMINQQLENIKFKLDGYHVKTTVPRKLVSLCFLYTTNFLVVRNAKKSADPKILNNITTLVKIHEIICRVAQKTNLNYNIQMLPTLAHQFFVSLFSIFYYYWMVH